jgi:hypothetical protein
MASVANVMAAEGCAEFEVLVKVQGRADRRLESFSCAGGLCRCTAQGPAAHGEGVGQVLVDGRSPRGVV